MCQGVRECNKANIFYLQNWLFHYQLVFVFCFVLYSDDIPDTYHWKTVLIYSRAMLLPLYYPIMPSHLRHLWPLWPSLCSPINPLPRATTAHAHLSGTAGRAAGPGLPGLPSIQSSWKSHLPILLLSKTIKTQKIYNKSVSGSIWEKKKGDSVREKMFENWKKQRIFFSYLEKAGWTNDFEVARLLVWIPIPTWRM